MPTKNTTTSQAPCADFKLLDKSKQTRLIAALKLCVARLEEYPDAEDGIALEGARRILAEVSPPAPKREVTINAEQKLFVIPCGDGGYTCFGFENCYRHSAHLASLVGAEPPHTFEYGTLAGYENYLKLCRAYVARPDVNQRTLFDPGTPAEVQRILEEARQSGRRLRLFQGDAVTGKPWLEENDVVGTIGRSTGPQRVPLLIPSPRSTCGGAILTACIVAILDAKTGCVLYQAPGFEYPLFSALYVGGSELPYQAWHDGKNVASFATEEKRARYIAFQRGQRFTT